MMKRNLEDLAVFSGLPAFSEPLHVGCPNIGHRERLLDRVNDVLNRRWLANNGPCVQEFEQRIADLIGVRYCMVLCNGTVALEILTRALGLTGEVIVPSFTFIATAHALRWQGITPVFCDIDLATHNIDPARVEELITPCTTGIIGVHVWGRPCDVANLSRIARCHNLKLVFDAAHAFACSYNGRMIGQFGDAEVFSFHATKFFNTFEGGAVVTNSDEVAYRVRLMRDFGFAGYDTVIDIGTNGKMSELSAVMGLTGLESLDEFIDVNYRNFKQYEAELQGIAGVHLMTYNEMEKCNYQYIVLEIDETYSRITRDELLVVLHAENVLACRYFYPGCHRMSPYRSYDPHAGIRLTNTEYLSERVLSLPTGTAVGQVAISIICRLIRLAIENGEELGSRLKAAADTVV